MKTCNGRIHTQQTYSYYLLESSSQHAAHVQLVACGVIIFSSISAWTKMRKETFFFLHYTFVFVFHQNSFDIGQLFLDHGKHLNII